MFDFDVGVAQRLVGKLVLKDGAFAVVRPEEIVGDRVEASPCEVIFSLALEQERLVVGFSLSRRIGALRIVDLQLNRFLIERNHVPVERDQKEIPHADNEVGGSVVFNKHTRIVRVVVAFRQIGGRHQRFAERIVPRPGGRIANQNTGGLILF